MNHAAWRELGTFILQLGTNKFDGCSFSGTGFSINQNVRRSRTLESWGKNDSNGINLINTVREFTRTVTVAKNFTILKYFIFNGIFFEKTSRFERFIRHDTSDP